MEDYASIVPRGHCGFLYAGTFACFAHQPCCVCKDTMVTCTDSCVSATAVFDGHGGHSAADYMSKNLYKILSVSIDDETHNSERKVEGKCLTSAFAVSF